MSKTNELPNNALIIAEEPTAKNTLASQPARRPFFGFFFSILGSLTAGCSSIFLKKTVFFSGVDNAMIRFTIMLIVSACLAKYHRLPIFSAKNPNKYLLIKGASSLGLIVFYIALRLISPSDAVSLLNTNIIYVAIFSRIFFKEKFSIVHVIALALVGSGIIFITQPNFIFIQNQIFYNNSVSSNETSTNESSSLFSINSIGYGLALATAVTLAIASVATKELTILKTHFSIIGLYTSFIGLPLSIFMVIAFNQTGYEVKDFSLIHKPEFIYDILFVFISATTSYMSQIFIIKATEYEDATKVAMYKTAELLFTFILQYFILNIKSNVFNIVGSAAIAAGILLIMGFRLLEKKSKKWKENKYSSFKKIIFFKF